MGGPDKALRRYIAIILVGVGIPLVWYFWDHWHRPPDREQIRRLIAAAQEGIESLNLRKALSIISENYRDEEGNDRRELARLAAGAFGYARSIAVHVSALSIQVEGNGATSTCEVTVVYTENQGTQQTQSGKVELAWSKERGRWKVVSLRGWHLAGPD